MMIGGKFLDHNATLLNGLTTGSQDQGMKSELGFSQDLTRGLAAVRALTSSLASIRVGTLEIMM